MASTRNKNTVGNYALERKMDVDNQKYNLYKHSQYGEAWSTQLPGNGLLGAQIYSAQLSHNPIQIESFLRGINSTNLVNPEPPLVPEFKHVETVDIYKRPAILMPTPLVIERNRPFPI
jgi:hypothetical protein